jgi:hypothetical protein
MASERRTRSSSEGCPSMGRKSTWNAARAEVIALGVMVAGSGVWGRLPFLKTRNVYRRGKHVVTDTFLIYGLHMTRSKSNARFVCCVCRVCCSKLVVNRNWWCGAGQMLASLLDGLTCVP